jgi:hypothetical protein
MQITIPDDRALRQRAAAAGFATVEEYVLALVERDARQDETDTAAQDDRSNEEWVRDFRSFVASLSSHNPPFDDSREMSPAPQPGRTSSDPAAVPRPTFPEQDENGVDLTLLRSVLALSPLERLRLMERKAKETRLLNDYGRRSRQ